jgi:hypothetical protein
MQIKLTEDKKKFKGKIRNIKLEKIRFIYIEIYLKFDGFPFEMFVEGNCYIRY